jgi:hypothetical protein
MSTIYVTDGHVNSIWMWWAFSKYTFPHCMPANCPDIYQWSAYTVLQQLYLLIFHQVAVTSRYRANNNTHVSCLLTLALHFINAVTLPSPRLKSDCQSCLVKNAFCSTEEFISAGHNDMGTADGDTVVKVLRYKSEGRWFDSRWCHWNFSLT